MEVFEFSRTYATHCGCYRSAGTVCDHSVRARYSSGFAAEYVAEATVNVLTNWDSHAVEVGYTVFPSSCNSKLHPGLVCTARGFWGSLGSGLLRSRWRLALFSSPGAGGEAEEISLDILREVL